MNRLILAAALAAGCMLSTNTPVLATAKNYDCSKPGNANKAVCKGAAKSAAAAAAKRQHRRHRRVRQQRPAERRLRPRLLRSRTTIRQARSRSARTAPTAILRAAPAPAHATAASRNGVEKANRRGEARSGASLTTDR